MDRGLGRLTKQVTFMQHESAVSGTATRARSYEGYDAAMTENHVLNAGQLVKYTPPRALDVPLYPDHPGKIEDVMPNYYWISWVGRERTDANQSVYEYGFVTQVDEEEYATLANMVRELDATHGQPKPSEEQIEWARRRQDWKNI